MAAFQQLDGNFSQTLVIIAIISSILSLITLLSVWRVLAKAGKRGCLCLIPIVNLLALFDIAGRPRWWIFLMIIPIVNLVIVIITLIDVAKAFGKGTAFGFGLFFLAPIFFAILGFGDADYLGV